MKKPAECLHFNICTRASYVFKMQSETYTVNIYNKQRLSKYLEVLPVHIQYWISRNLPNFDLQFV